jgi:predicted small metal-binding protein
VVPGCTMSFRATSEAELLEAVAAHARADHGLTSIPDSLVTQVSAKIRSAV